MTCPYKMVPFKEICEFSRGFCTHAILPILQWSQPVTNKSTSWYRGGIRLKRMTFGKLAKCSGNEPIHFTIKSGSLMSWPIFQWRWMVVASNIDMTVRNINDHVEEFDRGLFGFLSLKYFVCASVSCFDLARACILEGYKTKWIRTQSLMNLICISCKRHFTMKLHTSIYILHHPTGIFF